MPISLDDVHQAAKLAALRITTAEAEQYLGNLQRILDLARQMETIDAGSIQPAAYRLDITQRLRTDKITAKNQRDRLQKLTDHVRDDLYCVPPIIE